MPHPWLRRIPATHPPPVSAEEIIKAIRTIQESKPKITLACHPDDAATARFIEAWADEQGLWVTLEIVENQYVPKGQIFSMDAASLEIALDFIPAPPAAKAVGSVEEWLEEMRRDIAKRATEAAFEETLDEIERQISAPRFPTGEA